MQISSWQFKPGFWPTVATAILLPVLTSLGFWQIERGGQKEALQQEYQERRKDQPVDLNQANDALRQNIDYMQWRSGIARGSFDTDNIFLLDNQVVRGQAGYFVYAFFSLAEQQTKLLVNYGWLPVGDDRSQAPKLDLPGEQLDLTGIIKDVPATGIKLAATPAERLSENVFRLQDINLDELSVDQESKVLPYILRLTPPAPQRYLRDWQEPGFGKEKHYGYAFQWFALASALLVIYLLVNLKRISK